MFMHPVARLYTTVRLRTYKTTAEIRIEDVHRFIKDGLMGAGVPESEAKAQAELLVFSDSVGHVSHGSNRLEFYINDVKSGACNPSAKPCILKESGATAWVDGNNALGATIGNFCTSIAIEKAKKTGVGWVSAKRCNHFGMAAYWAAKPVKHGLLGMSFTNSSPVVVPTRSKQRALGTNPIAMACAGCGDDKLVFDIATSAVAMGKVELQARKQQPMPLGWALGPDGKPTTDAQAAYEAGLLMPLGGEEKTGGYKGYALSAMVEILCSGLSGSNLVHNIRKWTLSSPQKPPNLGQCFVAINPNCFAPGFSKRLSYYLKTWRNLDRIDKSRPVIAPGDYELANREKAKARGYIAYHITQIKAMNKLAGKLGIKPLQIIS